jgi:hypothetical protein
MYCHWLREGRPGSGGGSNLEFRQRIFRSARRPDQLWGPSLPYNVYLGLSLGVKRPGREADRSLTSDDVKKMWIYTIHFPLRLHVLALNLVKHRDIPSLIKTRL